MNTSLYSGTSGLVLPVAQSLYPPEFQGKSRLAYYASLYSSIEINSSFYKLPKSATVLKWAESVPDDFRFTFKISKVISHCKALGFNAEDVNLFMQAVEPVGNKKGCLLLQFPPGLKVEYFNQVEKLLNLIQSLNKKNAWKIAIEFRNTSWYIGEVYELVNHHKATIVIQDLPKSSTPFIHLNANFKYLRFHGPGGTYRGSYTDDFLKPYATSVQQWMLEKRTVYVYFNNTMGDALNNLNTINRLVQL